MKKIFALLLSVLLLMSLAACGGEPAAAEPAAAEPAAEPAGDEAGQRVGETRELTMCNCYAPGEVGYQTIMYFCDYIEEHTNTTFTRYTGGTFCSLPEEFGQVSSGAVDVATVLIDTAMTSMPYYVLATTALESQQSAVDYANFIEFENPETAALCDEQAAANNVKILGIQAGGLTAYLSTKEFESLDDLSSLKFGVSRAQEFFQALGLNVVSAEMADTYDSLSRGVFDCTANAFSTTVNAKWYEVAPYYRLMGTYTVANHLTVNLDTWNSLSAEEQQVFADAAQAACAYSVELTEQTNANGVAEIEEAGGSVGYFPDEDALNALTIEYAAMCGTLRGISENLGCTEGMETIIAACTDYLGLE